MTTATQTAPAGASDVDPAEPPRRNLGRLIRAELLKVSTTNIWWILAICAVVGLALALAVNGLVAHSEIQNALHPPQIQTPDGKPLPDDQANAQRIQAQLSGDLHRVLLTQAANVFTSGQFFGLLLVMLLGILIVTNEFFHQTATTTFLATPRRTLVILAKLGAAVSVAAGVWLVTALTDLGVGAWIFSNEGQPNSLGEWAVQRAILVNLPAYAIWAVLGVGLGVLIRSQIGATITGVVLYFIGTFLAQIFFTVMHQFFIKSDWVLQAQVAVPAVASQVMVSAEPVVMGASFDQGRVIYGPQWWVGALILVGYGVLFGVIGTLITRKRDIS